MNSLTNFKNTLNYSCTTNRNWKIEENSRDWIVCINNFECSCMTFLAAINKDFFVGYILRLVQTFLW